MQVRSKAADLGPLLNSVQNANEPLSRAEICERSGLTYNQLRKQLPQLIQSGQINWSSQRNDRGHEIRIYWAASTAVLLIALPSIMAFPVATIGTQSRITRVA